jgi:glycine/D-amino acid oxidase-like deaminating enzyme
VSALEAEATLAAALGFDASFVGDVPLVHTPGIMFEDQARFHPRKYLAGLARAITARGGKIFEHSEANEFSDKPRFVKANGHTVSCGYIVLATHPPLVGNDSLSKRSCRWCRASR